LEAFIDFLGCPDLFLTFSPAQEYWADLQKHVGTYDEWRRATRDRRLEIARRNIESRPDIAGYHFQKRFAVFRSTVLEPKFQITD
jgi:hypothetical protein